MSVGRDGREMGWVRGTRVWVEQEERKMCEWSRRTWVVWVK